MSWSWYQWHWDFLPYKDRDFISAGGIWVSQTIFFTAALSSERNDEIFSEEDQLPVSVKSMDDLDPEADYFEDDLEATHGESHYLDSDENTEESDLEKADIKSEQKSGEQ